LPNSSQQPGRFARMIYRNSFRTSQWTKSVSRKREFFSILTGN
jgi:hypothetical protein